jgi:hypothetical protein
MELLEAERVWIENTQRPEPHPRDIELMRRAVAGEVDHISVWRDKKAQRFPTIEPGGPSDLNVARSIAAVRAHATRWKQRAADAATEEKRAACLARAC